MTDMTREQKLNLIYRHTHRDFKGVYSKTRYILAFRSEGTCSVPLTNLTPEEVEDRLPYALKLEANRKAKVS